MQHETIDIWVVDARLGAGGMGTVYRCHNRDATRIQAAIKVLEPRLARSGELRRRFIREAELLFELDHPHIVKVRNIRMESEPPFIEMEFVEGASLQDYLQLGPMAPGAAAHLAGQVASALAHCHARGVRHRDVKPSNILVRKGHATLVDFGIAAEADGTVTHGGSTVGTLSYTPPEWGDIDADNRLWDTYSLGVVLYELLTGQMAFPSRTGSSLREEMFRLIHAKQKIAYLDPGEEHPELLRELVRRLTAREPAERPTELDDVAKQLADFASDREDVSLAEREATLRPTAQVSAAGAPTLDADEAVGSPDKTVRWEATSETMDAYGIDEAARAAPESKAPTLSPPGRPDIHRGISWMRVAGLTLGAALVGGLVLLSPFGTDPEPADEATVQRRPVYVTIDGEDLGRKSQVYIDGEALEVDARRSLATGTHTLEVRLGDGCTDGPSTECLKKTRELTVLSGVGPQRLGIELPTPPEVALSFEPALPENAQVRVGDGEWIDPAQARVRGGAAVRVSARKSDCTDTRCPEDSDTLNPPLNPAGPVVAFLDLQQQASRRAPAPAPAPAPRTTGRIVTIDQLAAFLKDNPNYQSTRMKDAPEKYLHGWEGAEPPPGSHGSSPAVHVSPELAQAVCADRGGLHPVTAPPTSWIVPAGNSITLEYRQQKGEVIQMQFNGEHHSGDAMSVADGTTRFRCAR